MANKPDDHISKMDFSTVTSAMRDLDEQIFALVLQPRKNEIDYEKLQTLQDYRSRLHDRREEILQDIEDVKNQK